MEINIRKQREPGRSIGLKSAAIYNLLDNEKFDKSEILNAHRAATIRRMAGHPVILAVRDTAPVNYDSRQGMEGNGYISDKTMGVNIHRNYCSALPCGNARGIGTRYVRPGWIQPGRKENTALTREQQKNRPIEEKESNRWLATMENSDRDIPEDIKVLHVCDREGDNYELFDKAIQSGRHFLIRIAKNRMTVENEQMLDTIRETPRKGRIKALIPRDSRRNLKEREVIPQIRYRQYEIKRSQIKNKNKALLPSLAVQVIYVKEEEPPKGIEPIE